MTTLRERLSDLADEAPSSLAPGPMWATGRRRHRKQQVGTAVVVTTVVVLLAGLTGLSWSRAHVDVQPATPETQLGLPDHFYVPSERLPGTDEVGPIGPLSAVVHGLERLTAVSGTGEYAFLDLPGWRPMDEDDVSAQASLSADGTRLAYWGSGEPSGEPIYDHAIVSVRVYDTVNGDVKTYDVPTEHGVQPETLRWAGDTLWFEIWQYDAPEGDGSRSGRLERTVAWDPERGSSKEWDGRLEKLQLTWATEWDDALVVMGGQGTVRLFRPEGTENLATVRSPRISEGVFLDENGTRLAGLRDTDGGSSVTDEQLPVVLGAVPEPPGTSSPVRMNQVPGMDDVGLQVLFGWRDQNHLVGFRYGNGAEAGISSVDVRTGELELLSVYDLNVPELAADALRGPVFDAPPPPEPMNPTVVYGGIAAIVLLGGALLLWWRRRVQR
jgi:hypothetical protein